MKAQLYIWIQIKNLEKYKQTIPYSLPDRFNYSLSGNNFWSSSAKMPDDPVSRNMRVLLSPADKKVDKSGTARDDHTLRTDTRRLLDL